MERQEFPDLIFSVILSGALVLFERWHDLSERERSSWNWWLWVEMTAIRRQKCSGELIKFVDVRVFLFDRNPWMMREERGLLWPLENSSGSDRSEQKVGVMYQTMCDVFLTNWGRAWLIKSGFVSVGYTPQTTDICVCHRHVVTCWPTGRRRSVKSALFLPTKLCRGIVSPTQFSTCR